MKDLINGGEEYIEASGNSDRKQAYDDWVNTPAPTSRDEYWKYTRVAPLLKKSYSLSDSISVVEELPLSDLDAYRLVFINGVFDESRSDIIDDGNKLVCDINYALNNRKELWDKLSSGNEHSDDDYFSLLNTAFYQSGPFIHLGKNESLDKPVLIIHLAVDKDRLVNTKGYFHLESGAELQIMEDIEGLDAEEILSNSRNDAYIGENAKIEWTKVQSIAGKNHYIGQDFISQQRDSRSTVNTISMDGKLIRNNLNIDLAGENAECHLNGLYMMRGQEHVDNHTLIRHLVPNCESNELYKGIMNEKAKGVFNGKVIVEQHAQKTNAFQYNANLLLTDEAEVYSKPELEIYADDVKCSHGSTTGQLDEEALFYLQARGISNEKARQLLQFAFAKEVLEGISQPELKEKIEDYLSKRYKVGEYA